MPFDGNVPRFFLGANSACGFFSHFDALYETNSDWRTIILKGGPGSGKSTLMNSVATKLAQQGQDVEWIFCSSDPKSLDAVIFPKIHFCIADGTAPHVLEPKFPGACETLLNPGDFWDSDALYLQRKNIFLLNQKIAQQHRRSQRYLSAAGSLLSEMRGSAEKGLDARLLNSYVTRLSHRLFPKRRTKSVGDSPRFLSGFTPDGNICFWNTLPVYAKTITAIEDDYGAASSKILSSLREYAQKVGYRTITCTCPLFPKEKTDALIVPEQSVAFITVNSFLKPNIPITRTVHTRRFYSEDLLPHRQKFRLTRRLLSELFGESTQSLQKARELHDELELIYQKAMDFQQLSKQTDTLTNEILRRL